MPGYNGDTPLHLAAILGDVEIVQRILEYGVDIDTLNRNVGVPLEEAVRHSRESASMRLLESGTVDTCGENSRTALTETSSVSNLAPMETLIEKGAKVDFPDINGQTALMEASKRGHNRIDELLLENQSNVDHQDHKGDTALMKACIGDHADVIELLVAANAQLDIENDKGDTALDHGGRYCGEDSIKRLLHQSTDPTIRDQHSGTVLISASHWKRPNIVSLILKDAKLKPTSKFINLALSEACSNSNEKVVRLLIDHGANPNTPLKSRRRLSLLTCWINIEGNDRDESRPIHAAAARGTKTVVQSRRRGASFVFASSRY
ncbi:hypothetical protein ACKRZS_006323 [Fusarium odoratissimum]